jgi:hypothetical protein
MMKEAQRLMMTIICNFWTIKVQLQAPATIGNRPVHHPFQEAYPVEYRCGAHSRPQAHQHGQNVGSQLEAESTSC